MPPSILAKDVAAVRDYVAEHGWCQQEFSTADGRVCITGAINRAVATPSFYGSFYSPNFLDLSAPRRQAVYKLIRSQAWDDASGRVISEYNDRVLKTQDEALEFLDKCVIAAEEKVS